jgi:hypothetical protein
MVAEVTCANTGDPKVTRETTRTPNSLMAASRLKCGRVYSASI